MKNAQQHSMYSTVLEVSRIVTWNNNFVALTIDIKFFHHWPLHYVRFLFIGLFYTLATFVLQNKMADPAFRLISESSTGFHVFRIEVFADFLETNIVLK